MAGQQLYLPQRRRAGGASVQGSGPGLHHWVPGSGYSHWAVGHWPGCQRRGHPALCRIWRRADVVPGRAGAGAQTPLGPAPPHIWLGQRPGAGLHGGDLSCGLGIRGGLEDCAGGRAGPGAVQHRYLAAGDGRTQPAAHVQRAGGVLDPAVPGRGGYPDPGAAAVIGRNFSIKSVKCALPPSA